MIAPMIHTIILSEAMKGLKERMGTGEREGEREGERGRKGGRKGERGIDCV